MRNLSIRDGLIGAFVVWALVIASDESMPNAFVAFCMTAAGFGLGAIVGDALRNKYIQFSWRGDNDAR